MSQFNFCKEMVYGQKHLQKVSYPQENYRFIEMVTDLFSIELSQLHTTATKEYDVFMEIGKDSNTEFHKLFYNKLRDNWPEIQSEYERFIQEVILPYLKLEEALVQKFPSFRVQLPNNQAVCCPHYDSCEEFNHPNGEVNFVFAFTDMFDTNTIWIETMPRMEEYVPINLSSGECMSFNGNKCTHFNKLNQTGQTRVSWDFRVLPLQYYSSMKQKTSATTHIKFTEGNYYKRFKQAKNHT